jgi:hypothetical protein
MTRASLIALALPALLIAGCSGGYNDNSWLSAEQRQNPAFDECRTEARNSPEIRAAWRQMNATNRTHEDRVNAEAILARDRALDDCLRRRGVIRGGGVERVRPEGWWW